jgi:23S rRNA pseudouridine1911/1915/1917 synthase
VKEIIYTETAPVRIDKFLVKEIFLSREYIKKEIESGNISINGTIVKPSVKLKKNDKIIIKESVNSIKSTILPQKYNLDILFEDEEIIVINKPPKTLTHPTTKILTGTIINFILYHTKLSCIGLPLRPGVVHRLDKDTSGAIVFAKTDMAYWNLINQFKERKVKKYYIAIVKGIFPSETKEISLPLNASKKQPTKRSINFSDGKPSLTYLKVLAISEEYSIIQAHPITGRTHQIRLVLSFLGYPILGDEKYGEKSILIDRQALHAYSLSFYHPVTNEFLTFKAPIPEDIKLSMKKINIDINNLKLNP